MVNTGWDFPYISRLFPTIPEKRLENKKGFQ
jgi:hypothetical protein